MHNTVKSLINDPLSENRFNIWSYININQYDRGIDEISFGEMGYLSGVFRIFDNNSKYCLDIVKKSLCYVCKKENIYNLNAKCLFAISESDLKLN